MGSIFAPASLGVASPFSNMASSVGIDFHVSMKVKQQVWSGDYFDLALLLNKNAASPPEASFSLDLDGPTPTFKSALPKASVKITDIMQWIEAFETFIAIEIQRSPASCAGLLKHSQNVRELYTLGGDWMFYDQQFRLMRRNNPIPWDLGCPTLWSKALARRAIIRHPSTSTFSTMSKPFQSRPKGNQKPAQPKHPRGFCFSFSEGRQCSKPNCQYFHKCYRCNQAHPASSCSKVNKPASTGGFTAKSANANRCQHTQ
jgi:hypothetical protein